MRHSPSPLSNAFSCVLLSRFLCLPSDAARRFFKRLRIQLLNVRYWNFSILTCSVCVACWGNSGLCSSSVYRDDGSLFMLPVFRDHEALHEVSGVKVPRPASPFITHETPSVTRRDGGCCISWQVYGWVYVYFDLVCWWVMWLSWPYYSYGLDNIYTELITFICTYESG